MDEITLKEAWSEILSYNPALWFGLAGAIIVFIIEFILIKKKIIFGGFEKKINEVDLDSMMGMAQKLASMTGEEFTMKNLVKEYMESDVHKQNLAEIAEAKKSSKGK